MTKKETKNKNHECEFLTGEELVNSDLMGEFEHLADSQEEYLENQKNRNEIIKIQKANKNKQLRDNYFIKKSVFLLTSPHHRSIIIIEIEIGGHYETRHSQTIDD